MDIYCCNCGEPWDIFCVTDYDEKQGMFADGAVIAGYKIKRCPCCPKDKNEIDPAAKDRAERASVVADLLGDDIDGAAAIMEDFEYLYGE